MKNKVVFVIVTYRPHPRQLEQLLNVLAEYSIIKIDNTKEKNLGYAGGANAGIKLAMKQRAKWVVILNQDLIVSTAGIKRLIDRLQDLPVSIAGPLAGRLDAKRYTTIITSRKIDYLSGSCLAIHRAVVDKVGNFYEPYFMYYEDADYCLRARRAGFKLHHIDLPQLLHEESSSLGKGSMLHEYYLARNHLLFVERQAPPNVKLHEIIRLPKTVWEHYENRNRGALLGIKNYLLRRFGQYQENL